LGNHLEEGGERAGENGGNWEKKWSAGRIDPGLVEEKGGNDFGDVGERENSRGAFRFHRRDGDRK
jgi:hypothetical protein